MSEETNKILLEARKEENANQFAKIYREFVSEAQKREAAEVFRTLLKEGDLTYLSALRQEDPEVFACLLYGDLEKSLLSRDALKAIYEQELSAPEIDSIVDPDDGENAVDSEIKIREQCCDELGKVGAYLLETNEDLTLDAMKSAVSLYQQIVEPDRGLSALFYDAMSAVLSMERFSSLWASLISPAMKLLYATGKTNLREGDPSGSPFVIAKRIRFEQQLLKLKKDRDMDGFLQNTEDFFNSLGDYEEPFPENLADYLRVRTAHELSMRGVYSEAVRYAETALNGNKERYNAGKGLFAAVSYASNLTALASCTVGERAVQAYEEAIAIYNELSEVYSSAVLVYNTARACEDLSDFYRTVGASEEDAIVKEDQYRNKALELMEKVLPKDPAAYGNYPLRMASFALMLKRRAADLLSCGDVIAIRDAMMEAYDFLWKAYRSLLEKKEVRELHAVLSVIAYEASLFLKNDRRPEEAARWCRRMLTEEARIRDKNAREIWRSIPHDLLAAEMLGGTNEALALMERAEQNLEDLRGFAELNGRKESWRDLRIRKTTLKALFCEEKWENTNIPAWIANTEAVVRELNEAEDLGRDQSDMLYAVMRIRNAQILLYEKCGQHVRAQETMKVLENEFPVERAFAGGHFSIPVEEEKRQVLETAASYMLRAFEKELNPEKMLRMAQVLDHLYGDRILDKDGHSLLRENERFVKCDEFIRVARYFAGRDPERRLEPVLKKNLLPILVRELEKGSLNEQEDRELLAKVIFETEWEEVRPLIADGMLGNVPMLCCEDWYLYSGRLQAYMENQEKTIRVALRRVFLYALKGQYETAYQLLPKEYGEDMPSAQSQKHVEFRQLLSDETIYTICLLNNILLLLKGFQWKNAQSDLTYYLGEWNARRSYYEVEEALAADCVNYLGALALQAAEDKSIAGIPAASFMLLSEEPLLQKHRAARKLQSEVAGQTTSGDGTKEHN